MAFGLTRAMSGSQPMRSRFQQARDRMTAGLREAGYRCARRRIDLFPVRRSQPLRGWARDEPFAERAVNEAGVAVIPLSVFAEAAPAEPRSTLLRQEGRDDRRWRRRNGESERDVRMTPAEETANRSELAGIDCGGQPGQLFADRRQADRPGDGRGPRRRRGSCRRGLSALAFGPGTTARRVRPAARRRLREAKPHSPSWSRSRPARSCQESLGEVQEMIDICDFAVGLSRQLHGLTIASERPGHRMMEQWHPLGPVWSSPRSISRSRSGPGTRRSRWCAATP